MFNPLLFRKHLQPFVWIIQLSCCILYTGDLVGQTVSADSLKNKGTDTFRISKDAIESIIEYKANDSTFFDLSAKKAILYGDAQVIYDGLNLKAYMIIVDFDKRELYAKGRIDSLGRYVGKPQFNDGERETEADTMIYNFNTKRGRTYGISMKEGEGFILCNKVFRDNDKSIYSDQGKYTTCNNREHPHFYLLSNNLKIIPEKKIIFGPSNLVIEGIPTPLVIPFGLVPTNTQKKSGLIPFEYGSSGTYGPFLRNLGYHLAISEKFDQSISGDIYFRGSWRLASNTRYNTRYKFNGNLNIEFSKYLNGEREDLNFKTNNTRAFRIFWQHNQDPKARPGSTFSANVNVQKNNAARLNSFNATTIVSNEFGSSVSYSKTLIQNRLDLRASALHRQNTQNNNFSMTLPNLTISMQRITPFSKPDALGKYKWYKDFGVSYQMEMENRIDTKDSIFFSGKPLEGIIPGFSVNVPFNISASDQFKQGIVHSIPITLGSYKFFKQHFAFTPVVSYKEYWYFKTVEKNWNSTLKKVDTTYNNKFSRASDYSASFNISTQVFGTFQFNSKKISAMRHTMTPNIGMSYRPDYKNERYGYYKTIQVDTLGNRKAYSIYEQGIKGMPQGGASGLINFRIENNLQAKVLKKTDSTSKYENSSWIENITVSGNYNLLDSQFRLSNIGVNGFTTLFKKVRINANANLDPYARNGNTRINVLQWKQDRRIGTWTSAGISMNTGINADMFRKKKSLDTAGKIQNQKDKDEFNDIMMNPYGYVNFDMPWSMDINYSLNYYRSNYKTVYAQNMTLRGDVNLTPKWKIGCSTGYNFNEKKIAYTQFEVSRLLHCWALNFSWIPDGYRKSFVFSLKANSSILQSLKVDKKRYWWDQ